jgi:eukaryotic-like serine/threonine-protein kinase
VPKNGVTRRPRGSLVKSPSSADRADVSAPESFMGPKGQSTPMFGGAIPEGTVIGGKYRVERGIGEGAMGVVVAARHLELDELVAIKVIRPEMHALPDVMTRFSREAKASAHLKGEHVAKVIDVGVAPSIGPYMVMEYLEGQNLAAVLQQNGALPVRRATEYVMQVCEALALAHAASITHRDVKPENLFLTRRGDLEIIKVLDFGISKTALHSRFLGGEASVRETSSLMGTPLYMSPEQIRATHEVDHRTDIWSLGVVLFELLTGRAAFAGETVTQVCALVLESTPPRLGDHCHTAPDELGRIVERCLSKDPARRYQTAAELAVALLPFAPSRARLHAERAQSVLRVRPSTLRSEPPASTMPVPQIEQRITAPPDSPTVFGAEPSQRSGRTTSRTTAIALFVVGFLLLGFFGTRLFMTSASEAPPAAAVLVPKPPAAPPDPSPRRQTTPPATPSDHDDAPTVTPARTAAERARAARRTPTVRPKAAPAVVTAPAAAAEPMPTAAETAAAKRARARLLEERKQARLLE